MGAGPCYPVRESELRVPIVGGIGGDAQKRVSPVHNAVRVHVQVKRGAGDPRNVVARARGRHFQPGDGDGAAGVIVDKLQLKHGHAGRPGRLRGGGRRSGPLGYVDLNDGGIAGVGCAGGRRRNYG
jgi:hypothetical protein